MRIYLCSRFGRKNELLGYAEKLASLGHVITSSWLASTLDDDPVDVRERAALAAQNVKDIQASDILLAFAEPPGSEFARGGRHVDFGIALGYGVQPIVVGHRENVYSCLDEVEYFDTFLDAVDRLGTMRSELKGVA